MPGRISLSCLRRRRHGLAPPRRGSRPPQAGRASPIFKNSRSPIWCEPGFANATLTATAVSPPTGFTPTLSRRNWGEALCGGKAYPPPLLPHTMVRLQADLLGREGRRGHIAPGFLGSGLIDQSQPAPDRIAAVSRDRIAAEARIYVLQSIRAENCRRPVRMSRRSKL